MIRLRPAEPGDLAAINALLKLEGRQAEPHDLEQNTVVLAERDGQVVGLGAIHIWRDLGRWSARMSSLIVHPDHRGQGVAKALVAERIRIARGVGRMRVLGSHNPNRPASGHILESQGMRPAAGAQTFYIIDV